MEKTCQPFPNRWLSIARSSGFADVVADMTHIQMIGIVSPTSFDISTLHNPPHDANNLGRLECGPGVYCHVLTMAHLRNLSNQYGPASGDYIVGGLRVSGPTLTGSLLRGSVGRGLSLEDDANIHSPAGS